MRCTTNQLSIPQVRTHRRGLFRSECRCGSSRHRAQQVCHHSKDFPTTGQRSQRRGQCHWTGDGHCCPLQSDRYQSEWSVFPICRGESYAQRDPARPELIGTDNGPGATNFRGQIVYMAEGAGPGNTSNVILMNPKEPYNTTVLLNNFFGRQFSSLNDVVVHPVNKDLYFTDTLYGYLQDFRPAPGLRNQVYRWNDKTGAVTVAADGFVLPNGSR